MKPKTLFILSAVIILIIYFFTRKETKIQPPEEIKPPQETAQQETDSRDYSYLLPPLSSNTPSITVIKKIPSKKTVSLAEETQKKIEEVSLPQGNLSVSPGTTANGPAKNNQYLTEEQKKEMKTHNVVLY